MRILDLFNIQKLIYYEILKGRSADSRNVKFVYV